MRPYDAHSILASEIKIYHKRKTKEKEKEAVKEGEGEEVRPPEAGTLDHTAHGDKLLTAKEGVVSYKAGRT